MKKTVRIFVAGSKDLKSERNALKAIAQDLNVRYSEQGVDVFIETKSYEEFKDRQKEYNKYISEYADLAIFILDGKIGDFTRSEFLTAVDAYKKKEIPEILVFLKSFDEETEDIKDIKNLMRDSMGEHFFYINYTNDDDLKSKAKERINRFIIPTEHFRDVKKWRMTTFFVVIAALLILGSLFVFNKCLSGSFVDNEDVVDYDNRPMLLFIGGGSVYKFIEGKGGVKVDSIKDYPNSIYMPSATSNIWGMLAEEYYRDRLGQEKYFPIFMAAGKIDTAEINRKTPTEENLSDNMLICELNIGSDLTVVYFKQEPEKYEIRNIDKKRVRCLSLDQLCKEIENASKKNTLYTTSLKSGTYQSYYSVLKEQWDSARISNVFNTGRKEFHEAFKIGEREDYVVLGSVYYYPLISKNSSAKSNSYCVRIPDDFEKMYYVLNKRGNFCPKDMCIYFVAYHTGNTNDEYEIPGPIMDFLTKKLNLKIKEPQWNDIVKNNGVFSMNDIKGEDIFDKKYIVRFNAELKRR